MLYIGKFDTNPNLILVGDGVISQRVRSAGIDSMQKQMAAGLSRWHHPNQAGFPLITSWGAIPAFNSDVLRTMVGIESQESINDAKG